MSPSVIHCSDNGIDIKGGRSRTFMLYQRSRFEINEGAVRQDEARTVCDLPAKIYASKGTCIRYSHSVEFVLRRRVRW